MQKVLLTMDPSEPLVRKLQQEAEGEYLITGAPVTRPHHYADHTAREFWTRLVQAQADSAKPSAGGRIVPAFDWTLFTSPRGVQYFAQFWKEGWTWVRVLEAQLTGARPKKPKHKRHTGPRLPRYLQDAFARVWHGQIATVGERTTRVAEEHGLTVHMTAGGSAKSLLNTLAPPVGKMFIPGSLLRKPTLAQGLHDLRAETVQELNLYTMSPVKTLPAAYFEANYVVVSAGSSLQALWDLSHGTPLHWEFSDGTVENGSGDCCRDPGAGNRHQHDRSGACGSSGDREPDRPPQVGSGHLKLICLGEPSAKLATEMGLKVHGVAQTPDAKGILAAVQAAEHPGG